MSASLPTAIVPFFGNMPMSFAGVVDVISTQRFRVIRFPTTPPSKSSTMRVSTPGAPFGIFEKSPIPSCFCFGRPLKPSVMQKGQ